MLSFRFQALSGASMDQKPLKGNIIITPPVIAFIEDPDGTLIELIERQATG